MKIHHLISRIKWPNICETLAQHLQLFPQMALEDAFACHIIFVFWFIEYNVGFEDEFHTHKEQEQ